MDVIEGNLPREVGSLRGSDYNTSEFIHRRDSSAPEVTSESASPKLVACARAHKSSTSLAERGGAVEERVTCVYSGVPCGTGNCERGEEKRESKRVAR